MYMTKHKR